MNVYCITFPNNKKYVGIESHTGVRKNHHSKCYSKNMLVTKAILKYGWKNCNFKYLISNAPNETCYHLEKKLIKLWKLQNRSFGYNISCGGEKPALGIKKSKQTIEKLKIARSKYKLTKEWKLNIAKTLTNKKHTENRRNNQALAKGAKPFYAIKIVDNKIIKCLGPFISKGICAGAIGGIRSKISLCLGGTRKTHNGYVFSYKSPDILNITGGNAHG